MTTADCFRIGSILKTKGLKGELTIYVDFEGIEKIRFSSVFIETAGKLIPYFVSSVKYPQKNTAYLQLEDVTTIEQASLLVKKDLYLPNKLKPKKKKEEFTLMDLKGFTAVDVNEGELGVISEINEYPQQFIASVTYKDNEVLFPLNGETIKGIDVAGKIIDVELPDGLLDIYLR
ncbi:MAG TPA: ribosome maturation factor RimM [Mucilaginibacter sp.]|nr:ribosome maturation factor RimM [Mucilaginibacter sp.]